MVNSLVIHNRIEIVGDFIVEDVECTAMSEIFIHQDKVVIKFVSHHRCIAVAKDEVVYAANDHNSKEKPDWENCRNASVGVIWEEVVPFSQNVAQAMCDKNCHGE